MPSFHTSLSCLIALGVFACAPGTGDETPDNPDAPFAECDTDVSWRDSAPLRRLTENELRNVLLDLLVGEDLAETDASGSIPLPEFQLPTVLSPDGYANDHHALTLNAASMEVQTLNTLATEVALLVYSAAEARGENPPEPDEAMKSLVERVVPRAFRRDLSADTLALWLQRGQQLLESEPYPVAKAMLIVEVLQAPQFLYRMEEAQQVSSSPSAFEAVDDWSIASRLSFLLWAGPPDDTLRQLAREGVLRDPEVRVEQVQRMLNDPKSERPIRAFMDQWMGTISLHEVSKDPHLLPEFTPQLWEDMMEETRRFAVRVMLDEEKPYDDLLLETETMVTPSLADIYGIEVDESEDWSLVTLDPEQRGGVLTQGTFLAGQSGSVHPHPVHRSITIMERILCCELPPLPDNVADTIAPAEAFDGPTTNRERFEETVSAPMCASCHESLNPTGFAYENYDAIGRYRTMDNGIPVDASGGIDLGHICSNPVYTDADGDATGAIEMNQQIAGSNAFGSCFVRNYARFAVGHHLDSTDACYAHELYQTSDRTGRTLQSVLAELVRHTGFIQRKWESS
jgi:hypothetical protein